MELCHLPQGKPHGRLSAERAWLVPLPQLLRTPLARRRVPVRSQLCVSDVIEADNTRILVILLFLDRTLERDGRRGRNNRRLFLLRSDADLLVKLPELRLVLLRVVIHLLVSGALERGGLGAARITAVRSGFRSHQGMSLGLASFQFIAVKK